MRTSFDEISGLPPPIARLLDELMQDHAFGREVVEPLCKWFTALDREGDDNPDALACMQAFAMIATPSETAYKITSHHLRINGDSDH